jgi:hypothetical protein
MSKYSPYDITRAYTNYCNQIYHPMENCPFYISTLMDLAAKKVAQLVRENHSDYKWTLTVMYIATIPDVFEGYPTHIIKKIATQIRIATDSDSNR